MKRISALIAPAAAAAAVLFSGVALAQDAPERTVHIRAGELNTEAGREAVRERIERASRQVCPVYERNSLQERRLARKCAQDARDHAEIQLERQIAAAERDARIKTADAGR
ncbi:MAG: UrcA family protein [Oceanicaulis sp.]